jgi:tetratricopeptide (TPR) repeat protein
VTTRLAALGRQSDLVLVIGIVCILLLLFAPIPPGLLDFLLLCNFSFALLLLMLTFYMGKPLEFSLSSGYLALLAMDSGQLADAQRLATEVLAESANDTNANLVAGTGSIEAQEIEQACRHFERVIAREPDNPRAWLGVGLARLYEQRNEEAVTALRKALDLLPDSVGIAVTLGWALLASRDIRGAERVFRQAIEIDRGFGEAHGGLAAALALQLQIDEAQQCIRRAERLDPAGFGAAFARMVVFKAQGQHDAATDVLAQALQRAPRPDAKSLIEQIQLFARKHPPSGPAVASKAAPAVTATTPTQSKRS